MNNLPKETLVVIIQTLSEKVEGQALVLGDLTDHIKRDHAEMDDMQFRLTDMSRRVDEKYHECERLRSANIELCAQVRQLTSENYKLKFGGQTPEETATAYMANQGATLWETGDKIAVYKVVKTVTEWGLRETKDFCEAYMARKEEERKSDEVSGPGTKRSSQIPAGVGTNVRKSA